MTIFVHHFIGVSYCRVSPPDVVSEWPVRPKKVPCRNFVFKLISIADIFDSWPDSLVTLRLTTNYQNVGYWIIDFLHGLRQSAARVYWR